MKCVLLPLVFIAFDYFKNPIDRLYFHKPLRPFVGMRNTLVDALFYRPFYYSSDFCGLDILKLYYIELRDAVLSKVNTLEKHYFHDDDAWFEKNENYYYYKLSDIPEIKKRVEMTPCVAGGMIAVMDGPIIIPPHRAEHNLYLRYHLTLEGTSTLDTEFMAHEHKAGDDFVFDHARYHKVEKTTSDRRIVLILDIRRF
jgi:hypothetical protein